MAEGLNWVTYNDDAGTPYNVLLKKETTAQGALGFSAAIAGQPGRPIRFKMRRAHGKSAGGKSASVAVGGVDATIWTGVATTFVVRGDDGTNVTYTVTSLIGEKRPVESL